MEIKKETERLLSDLKNLGIGRKEIEEEFGYSPNYISQALSKGGNEKLLLNLKKMLQNARPGSKPSLPGDALNRERALIKVLFHRVVKLEAQRLGLSEGEVMAEMEKDTRIALADLEQG